MCISNYAGGASMPSSQHVHNIIIRFVVCLWFGDMLDWFWDCMLPTSLKKKCSCCLRCIVLWVSQVSFTVGCMRVGDVQDLIFCSVTGFLWVSWLLVHFFLANFLHRMCECHYLLSSYLGLGSYPHACACGIWVRSFRFPWQYCALKIVEWLSLESYGHCYVDVGSKWMWWVCWCCQYQLKMWTSV